MSKKKKIKKHQKGFTLLEILLVVAAIAILAGIVILALNPAKQLAETRNAQRWSNVNAIINGVYQYIIDNKGTVPALIPTTATEICKTGIAAATCTTSGLIDLSTTITLNETYLTALPIDPLGSVHVSGNGTGYTILKTANGRITISAPKAERSVVISVTK